SARRARVAGKHPRRGAVTSRVRQAGGAALMAARTAPAKINLALVVGPVDATGKHEVTTVLQRVRLADRITLESAAELSVEGFPADTLVTRALTLLAAAAGVPPRWVATGQKEFAVASGLGVGRVASCPALPVATATR